MEIETRNHWELMFGAPDIMSTHERAKQLRYERLKYLSPRSTMFVHEGQSPKE